MRLRSMVDARQVGRRAASLRAGARLLAAIALLATWPGVRPADVGAAGMLISVVASTNVYADVVSQLGGSHVKVIGILNNPNTDPHTYESSTADAGAVARAALVVQNGLGYDAFMGKLEDASPSRDRTVIEAGKVLGYKDGDNPHLWYRPETMPRLAPLIVTALVKRDAKDAAAFRANLRTFNASLKPWTDLIARVRARYAGTPVAVTEPVFGYAADAMGLRILTPRGFSQAIQEGTDPAPQDVQAMKGLFSGHKVRAFFTNQQAVAPITNTLLDLARARHIPIVGVYETRPAALTYQQWMLAEVLATQKALAGGVSTEKIQ